ncbi:hypothetical protein [Heyndrickxia ginsengihumi]|uniref:hypothetical protein n=1 Tax=Heyndrickxia ginsengihumi TaxID=363870 RepID=UPI00068D7FD1|nr:hypothetical protein [Heyndrickxia ginsengihumi]
MDLPKNLDAGNPVVTESGSYVYTADKELNLIVQPTIDGVRTVLNIKDASAPKSYKFDLRLSPGDKLVTAADYLGNEYDTGEVFIVGSDNIIKSVFEPAWAKDANGNNVETYYKVQDNSLVQVVKFDENTAFPVIADPSWTAIGACAAALTWFVGSNLFAASKIIKVKKYIKELGGISKAAKLIAGATSWEEKLRVGGSALRHLAAEITGVTGLYACTKLINKSKKKEK